MGDRSLSVSGTGYVLARGDDADAWRRPTGAAAAAQAVTPVRARCRAWKEDMLGHVSTGAACLQGSTGASRGAGRAGRRLASGAAMLCVCLANARLSLVGRNGGTRLC